MVHWCVLEKLRNVSSKLLRCASLPVARSKMWPVSHSARLLAVATVLVHAVCAVSAHGATCELVN